MVEDVSLVILEYDTEKVDTVLLRHMDLLAGDSTAEIRLESDLDVPLVESLEVAESVPPDKFGADGQFSRILVSHEGSIKGKVNTASGFVLGV